MAVHIPSGHTLKWAGAGSITSQRYRCWNCGNALASEKGWVGHSTHSNKEAAYVAICHYCQRPTYIDERDSQHPWVSYGNPVPDIADEHIEQLYSEARHATGAGANTAAVLACRKLLMHIAVAKGAEPNKSFLSYVEYLAEKNYIPPDARQWVDHIRAKGNEANHEIVIMSADEAKELLSFTEMLLKLIFEFPAAIRKRQAPEDST